MKDLRLFLGQGGVMKSPPYVVTRTLKQTYLMKTRLEWVGKNERKILTNILSAPKEVGRVKRK